MNATADLPDEIDALKAIIRAQQEHHAVQAGVIDRKETRIIQLEKLVADYKRAMFGARSEKTCPEQYDLALEDIEAAQEAVHAEDEADDRQISGKPRPRKANRGSLPKHLPRVEEVIEPESTRCACGHDAMSSARTPANAWISFQPSSASSSRAALVMPAVPAKAASCKRLHRHT